jgi:hypothetical protein
MIITLAGPTLITTMVMVGKSFNLGMQYGKLTLVSLLTSLLINEPDSECFLKVPTQNVLHCAVIIHHNDSVHNIVVIM